MKVECSHGFIYEVDVEHHPTHGFADASYNGRFIGQTEIGKTYPPLGDCDAEWERWEEHFAEWRDQAKVNLMWKCVEFFDNEDNFLIIS